MCYLTMFFMRFLTLGFITVIHISFWECCYGQITTGPANTLYYTNTVTPTPISCFFTTALQGSWVWYPQPGPTSTIAIINSSPSGVSCNVAPLFTSEYNCGVSFNVSSMIQFLDLDISNGGNYECRITDSGSSNSYAVAYVVIVEPNVSCPSFIQGAVTENGTTTTVACSLGYGGNWPFNVNWTQSGGIPFSTIQYNQTTRGVVNTIEVGPFSMSDVGTTETFRCNSSMAPMPGPPVGNPGSVPSMVVPSYDLASCEVPVELQYYVQKTSLTYMGDSLEVGDVMNCSADGDPAPEYSWSTNITQGKISNGPIFMIPNELAGEFVLITCTAYNTLSHAGNMRTSQDADASVFIASLPSTIAPTTISPSTMAETTTPETTSATTVSETTPKATSIKPTEKPTTAATTPAPTQPSDAGMEMWLIIMLAVLATIVITIFGSVLACCYLKKREPKQASQTPIPVIYSSPGAGDPSIFGTVAEYQGPPIGDFEGDTLRSKYSNGHATVTDPYNWKFQEKSDRQMPDFVGSAFFNPKFTSNPMIEERDEDLLMTEEEEGQFVSMLSQGQLSPNKDPEGSSESGFVSQPKEINEEEKTLEIGDDDFEDTLAGLSNGHAGERPTGRPGIGETVLIGETVTGMGGGVTDEFQHEPPPPFQSEAEEASKTKRPAPPPPPPAYTAVDTSPATAGNTLPSTNAAGPAESPSDNRVILNSVSEDTPASPVRTMVLLGEGTTGQEESIAAVNEAFADLDGINDEEEVTSV